MLEEFIYTIVIGLFGAIGLAIVGTIILILIHYPIVLAYFIGAMILIYGVGWCIKNWENFVKLIISDDFLKSKSVPRNTYMDNPVLDGLQQLEDKYKMSTITFMSFVSKNCIPYEMDNLDYLEWIALVTQLSTLNIERGE